MAGIILRVTYRVRTHQTEQYEKVLVRQVLPLAAELGIKCNGVWRSLVGNVGEYLELWEFQSFDEFERRWKTLLTHPDFKEMLELTGPMVEGENFSLLEDVLAADSTPGRANL